MKYSLIFAATAAAYDAYGGYSEEAKSSSVVKPSSAVKPVGYTTIVPGYGKQPVTVTTQHQAYPTCVSAGSDAKSCNKWEDDNYVSTTIKDCDNKVETITKATQPVTVYHTKKTITHSATGKYNGYSTPAGGYAAPTGMPHKNGTEGSWYELYEKIEEVPYNKMGPHALPGYPGSGLYKGDDKEQHVHVKEYKGGKWSEYDHVYSYGTPEDEVTAYEKPGVYTVPAKDVTVNHPTTYPAEATKTAKAGETCTYGGQYIDAKETGYVTGAYAAYETSVHGDKTVTETVVKYTTIFVTKTGKQEIAKPTTTVYDHDTEIAYPTAKHYEAGVYHHEAQTVTVTKAGQPYTRTYEQTKKYEPTSTPKDGKDHPAYPMDTPVHDNSHGNKPSATPMKPAGDEHHGAYPTSVSDNHKPHGAGEKPTPDAHHGAYPTPSAMHNSNQPHGDASYPASTPVGVHSAPHGGDHGYGADVKSASKHDDHEQYGHPEPTPVHDDKHYVGDDYPVKATSTPCDEDDKPSATSAKGSMHSDMPGHPMPTPAKPSVYSEMPGHPASMPVKPSMHSDMPGHPMPTPAKPSMHSDMPGYPASMPVKPSMNSEVPGHPMPTPAKPSVYSEAPNHPAPTPVKPSVHSEVPGYPVSMPVKPSMNSEVPNHPMPTPAKPSVYSEAPAHPMPTPAKPSVHSDVPNKPTPTPVQPSSEGYGATAAGYGRRSGMLERRRVAPA